MSEQDQNNHQAALIEDLLAAPFIAAANANSKMAQEQVKFLMESCFDQDGDSFTPKMVSLTIRSNGQPHSAEDEVISFELPIITIIPFNSLCVKDISVKFDMEVVSLGSDHGIENSDGSKKSMQMRGSVASSRSDDNSTQARNQSKMQVEITGGTIPLPVGLTTILKFYSNNIQLKS
ncbi:DUF2589 domain-containing protein [Chryseobacterium sp. FH1]|uniref:DUF2589 domain-containing protein n=1 Tax=Chryseobacterium sp. FH1 TaxID=1233951 RepID=UPI0004E2F4D8|nr:DUF2589 domain-containing protein [Chryseobacterium sp. FH1]KFC19665.1 hypothetical protein IO90_10350 [Chryseobacterium sp. FH1]